MMLSYDKSPNYLHGASKASISSATILSSAKLPNIAAGSHHRHLFIVYGPAGCGKSTVGEHVAKQFKFPYIEGDEVRSCLRYQKSNSG